MPKPGKSADSKGSAKMGYMMGGSEKPAGGGAGAPPKPMRNVIRNAKKAR